MPLCASPSHFPAGREKARRIVASDAPDDLAHLMPTDGAPTPPVDPANVSAAASHGPSVAANDDDGALRDAENLVPGA